MERYQKDAILGDLQKNRKYNHAATKIVKELRQERMVNDIFILKADRFLENLFL